MKIFLNIFIRAIKQYKLVISNDSVQFTTLQNDTLYGIGFESDMDLTHWKIIQPTGVTGRVIN